MEREAVWAWRMVLDEDQENAGAVVDVVGVWDCDVSPNMSFEVEEPAFLPRTRRSKSSSVLPPGVPLVVCRPLDVELLL